MTIEEISYKIEVEFNFTRCVLVFVYELIDDLNGCYESYLQNVQILLNVIV